jgi:hypothetical protein
MKRLIAALSIALLSLGAAACEAPGATGQGGAGGPAQDQLDPDEQTDTQVQTDAEDGEMEGDAGGTADDGGEG